MSLKDFFLGEIIKVNKEKDVTSAFNWSYDKFKGKQYTLETRKLLEMAWRKVHGQINQWHLIFIVSAAIQNISAKVWTYFFVYVNLHPYQILSFSNWIKKIIPDIKIGEAAYFWNHKESY